VNTLRHGQEIENLKLITMTYESLILPNLKCKLLDTFKVESGSFNPDERILPLLPGKKIFGRSNVKSVAIERKDALNEYCKVN
jgi:hypothetical protein